MRRVADCIACRVRSIIPQPTEWHHIGNEIDAAIILAGLRARLASHNMGPENCAEAVSILVAGAVHYHSGCSRKPSHIDFAPRFPARSRTAGESSHPIAHRRLCEFECLPRVSSRKLHELARVVSSHHDAGGDATEFAA